MYMGEKAFSKQSERGEKMEDSRIIELYFARDEAAISLTNQKYGRYLKSIAYNILQNEEDSDECVNDTYINAWNSIPPKKPNRLQTYLGKITRNISLNLIEKHNALKRGNNQVSLALDELSECIPNNDNAFEDAELTELINRFLRSLSSEACKVFVLRYWYVYSSAEISQLCKISESNVNVSLFRTRKKLKAFLEKEGITI